VLSKARGRTGKLILFRKIPLAAPFTTTQAWTKTGSGRSACATGGRGRPGQRGGVSILAQPPPTSYCERRHGSSSSKGYSPQNTKLVTPWSTLQQPWLPPVSLLPLA
jgi:hypothetical protein